MGVEMKNLDGLTATGETCAANPQARALIVTNYGGGIREAAARAGACGDVMQENLLELRGILVESETGN